MNPSVGSRVEREIGASGLWFDDDTRTHPLSYSHTTHTADPLSHPLLPSPTLSLSLSHSPLHPPAMDAEDYQEKLRALDRVITEMRAQLEEPGLVDLDRLRCG